MTNSFKPEFLVGGTWSANGMAFATETEALAWANYKMSRWYVPEACRAVPATAAVNYAWTASGAVAVVA